MGMKIGKFYSVQYLIMHSLMFQTKVLRESEVKLPEHTFYVDNIFVFEPLPVVQKMYYMNVNFYRYFIGREDQSVNEKVMISRVDQQIYVTKTMIDMYDLNKISSKKLKNYMINYLAIMMTVSSILLIRSKSRRIWQRKGTLDLSEKKDLKVF